MSPKGYDTFRILDDLTVAYLDLTGSGVETIAHLRDNGRITLMFCAFEGPPKIVRLQGRGEVLEPGDPGFGELIGRFDDLAGTRAIIRVSLDRVSDSCGYSVPFMDYQGERFPPCSSGRRARAPTAWRLHRRPKGYDQLSAAWWTAQLTAQRRDPIDRADPDPLEPVLPATLDAHDRRSDL